MFVPDKFEQKYNSHHARQTVADTWDIVLPGAIQLLFWKIDGWAYEEQAFVLFTQDGLLYEVNDSHCSCSGFEDWSPERTTVDALRHRIINGRLGKDQDDGDWDAELVELLNALEPLPSPAEVETPAKPFEGKALFLELDGGAVTISVEAPYIEKIEAAITKYREELTQ